MKEHPRLTELRTEIKNKRAELDGWSLSQVPEDEIERLRIQGTYERVRSELWTLQDEAIKLLQLEHQS
jgi:hypothetical protein